MTMNYAPIALFVYNRPWHTQQTIEALLANAEAAQTSLIVFSDGARNEEGKQSVSSVRAFIRSITGFKSIEIIERETNLGLARSIIDGVTRVCEEYGRVIVLEDDLVTATSFLAYMNEGLVRYEHDDRVISIHGYVYPVAATLPETFFLKGADCWGWATWKRGWDLFESDGRVLLQQLTHRKLTRRFDFDGAYPYTKMLKNQIKGKNDSWAIRWYASAFLKDRLTLYPGRSLVHNIGNDGSGTHCSETGAYSGEISAIPVQVELTRAEEHVFARDQIKSFFRATQPSISVRMIKNRFKDLAKKWLSRV
jgi:hypothetical protein